MSIENVVSEKVKEHKKNQDQEEAIDLNTIGYLNSDINDYGFTTGNITSNVNPFTIKGWLPKSVRDRKKSALNSHINFESTSSINADYLKE